MEDKREYDIIIWGASGFTGRLVAEYLHLNYNSNNLKWAIAGRDKKKLISIRDAFLDDSIPIVIADSFDEKSLNEMTRTAKVVCSTVGPYAKYGSLLVKSCVNNKTHYCDLAGEAQWIRKMIDLYHKEAITNQVKIVNSCGFDSIPSDMGCFYLHRSLGENLLSVDGYHRGGGGVSGGTIESAFTMKNYKTKILVRDILEAFLLICVIYVLVVKYLEFINVPSNTANTWGSVSAFVTLVLYVLLNLNFLNKYYKETFQCKAVSELHNDKIDYLKKKENLKKLNYQNTWINVNQKILRTINEN